MQISKAHGGFSIDILTIKYKFGLKGQGITFRFTFSINISASDQCAFVTTSKVIQGTTSCSRGILCLCQTLCYNCTSPPTTLNGATKMANTASAHVAGYFILFKVQLNLMCREGELPNFQNKKYTDCWQITNYKPENKMAMVVSTFFISLDLVINDVLCLSSIPVFLQHMF